MGANHAKEAPKALNIGDEEIDLTGIPARVDRVNISGLIRTKDDYVMRAVDGLFKARTLHDVYIESKLALQYIRELGIFKDVKMVIEPSRGEKATRNGYEITFKGKELSRIIGSIGTDIGQNEGCLNTELSTPNIWGRGERINLHGSYSNTKTTDLSLKLIKPFYHTSYKNYKPEFSIGIFQNATILPMNPYKTQNLGILSEFSMLTYVPFELSHILQYEASLRDLKPAVKPLPFFVRQSCGPRMASLIRTITTYDGRDDSVFPTNGLFLKTINEFCGLGGNLSYIQNSIHAELNFPIINNFTAQICSKIGIIHLNDESKHFPLNSLFTLGGPITLRGFKLGGAGPHCDGYACGLHSYWAIGVHLWGRLPFIKRSGHIYNYFRSHLFYNFANCDSLKTDNLRAAAGIGLAYKFADRARIELNYCFPLKKENEDRIQKGFQFGIGFDFI